VRDRLDQAESRASSGMVIAHIEDQALFERGETTMGYDQLESVEVSVEGVELPHQFRIWNTEPASMFVVVKQSSQILNRLKVGDTMKMTYYTRDAFCPVRTLNTRIRNIKREDQGRFRGHCLVGLAVADS
jgi:hypothetical protein